MALPVAHWALALGMVDLRARVSWACLAVLAILPDFDFFLVWGFDFARNSYHRTFSHSLFFSFLLVSLWAMVRPSRLKELTPAVCFLVLFSHALLDMLCTREAAEHGVMLFWPLTDHRIGWPVLVPLYELFAESPFSAEGTLRFTLLEVVLAVPLWMCGRLLWKGMRLVSNDE